jgi:uncharacterized protein (TIGR03437 family)
MRRAIALGVFLANALAAQSNSGWGSPPPAAIANLGYTLPPAILHGAPGQIVSLMVYGLAYKQAVPFVASALPLPTTLGGISVSLQQGNNTFQVPLLSVQQVCPTTPCAPLTVVTIQIPFEVFARCSLCGVVSVPGTLTVAQSGGGSGSILIGDFLLDYVHIPSMCDTTANPLSSPGTCAKLVTHGNGTIVDGLHPARVGEELVMYAFGLGHTTPELKTGEAAPSPGPVIAPDAFSLNFDFRVNAPPSLPLPNSPGVAHPLYVGAVPGFAGLYQVNFVVPTTMPDLRPCAGTGLSNLTVSLYTINSFDGAGICVQP